MINLQIDFAPIDNYLTFTEAHARVMNSGRTRNKWVIAMGLSAATAFDQYIDAQAAGDHKSLGHVYEWGQIGLPTGHLWHEVLLGSGNARVLDYIWRASRKSVPRDRPSNSMKKYVYRWKAPMTELGTRVTVEPMYGGAPILAFPAEEFPGATLDDDNDGWIYVRGAVNPGINKAAKGKFTFNWHAFFNGAAETITQDREMESYENFIKIDFNSKVMAKLRPHKIRIRKGTIAVRSPKNPQKRKLAERVTNEWVDKKLAKAQQGRRLYTGGQAV